MDADIARPTGEILVCAATSRARETPGNWPRGTTPYGARGFLVLYALNCIVYRTTNGRTARGDFDRTASLYMKFFTI